MTHATSYTLLYPDAEPGTLGEVHTHHQALEVGDVIQPLHETRWYRVVGIHYQKGQGRVARLSEAAASEVLAHNPKLTPR